MAIQRGEVWWADLGEPTGSEPRFRRPLVIVQADANTMKRAPVGIIGGFDRHTDMHVSAVLDPLGRLLGTESFRATPDGYRRALAWLGSFGPIIAVGVESTGSFGAALARFLGEQGHYPHPAHKPTTSPTNERARQLQALDRPLHS